MLWEECYSVSLPRFSKFICNIETAKLLSTSPLFSGILGIKNIVGTIEYWFWNDWFNNSAICSCNWKTFRKWGSANCVSIWRSEKCFRRSWSILSEMTEAVVYLRCQSAHLRWKKVRNEWWIQSASAGTLTLTLTLHLFHQQCFRELSKLYMSKRPNCIQCLKCSSESTCICPSDVLGLISYL